VKKKTEQLTEERWIRPGEFPWDTELKKKVYAFVSRYENEQNSIMLTNCYFNKVKYRSVYNSKIEKKLQKIKI
jgi:hypothetical protein